MRTPAPATQPRPATGLPASQPRTAAAARSPWSSASAAASSKMPSEPWPMTSYARAGFGREEDASRPTRRFRGSGSETPTPPESPTSLFPSPRLRLCFRNLVGERAQLLLVEHRRIHHAHQNLVHRTVAEPVDDALHGLGGDAPARLGRLIHKGAAVHDVGRVALLFQPPQDRPHGGLLERARQLLAHDLGRDPTIGPHQLHDLPFEVTEIRQAFVDFWCHANFAFL